MSGYYAATSLTLAIAGVVIGSIIGVENRGFFLLFLVPATALTYNAIKPINPLKGYKTSKGWKIKIIKKQF